MLIVQTEPYRTENVELRRTSSNYRRSEPSNYLATPPPEEYIDLQSPTDHELNGTPNSEGNGDPDPGRSIRNPQIHASASEFFHTPLLGYEPDEDRMALPHMPTLTRQTTYSSLPPSPRYETYELGHDSDTRRGFEEALERLTRTRTTTSETKDHEERAYDSLRSLLFF